MSDSEDTDDLLLIPPDFFLVESDSGYSHTAGPYYNIVDNLIKQVGNLQNRLKSIESCESFLSNSLDYCLDKPHNMQNSVNGFRKYSSTDDLFIPNSTQSTPQKPHSKFKLSSLPASPNIHKFNLGRNHQFNAELKLDKTNLSPKKHKKYAPAASSKEDGHMLNEIDTFLSKVKTIQRINAVRNLENEFECGVIPMDNKVDQFVDHFDNFPKNSRSQNIIEPIAVKDTTWRMDNNIETVPGLGSGVRENMRSQGDRLLDQHDNQSKNTGNQSNVTNDSFTTFDKYPFSDSSSDSTQTTAYRNPNKNKSNLLSSPLHSNALNILNKHKQLLEDSAERTKLRSKVRAHKPKGTNMISDNLGLLSLADMWTSNSNLHLNQTHLSQKLQEEKLRRQHCEDLIQELQNRNLELQQKLSVAVKVDESKNKAIQQFQEAIEKIITRLEKLNKEKRDWESEMSKLKNRHSNEMEEALKKIAYFEKEVSKAMNMAHGSQDEKVSMEKRCSELQNEIMSIEQKLRELQDNYERQVDHNKQLSQILSRKEVELNENKNTLNNARSEVAQSREAVEVCQAQFTDMKNAFSKLENELEKEKNQNNNLNEKSKKLVCEIEDYRKRERDVQEELAKSKKQIENNKVDLRNFYQGQVEILVQNKLKEFQCQLDKAEANFKDEIKKREISIAKTAATHIQQISEKYSLEIKLLEKKNHEETKLYQVQIMQYKQQIDNLQTKLDQFQEKRVLIAKQLQKIMESQWAEALKIISSGKSPTFKDETFSTIDQLNSLRTRSYNNVEEVLAQQQEEHFNIGKRQKNDQMYSFQQEETCSSTVHNDKASQNAFSVPPETPVSSRNHGNNQFNENDIQKYIHLLLNRPPGNPIEQYHATDSDKALHENDDRPSWFHVRDKRHR